MPRWALTVLFLVSLAVIASPDLGLTIAHESLNPSASSTRVAPRIVTTMLSPATGGFCQAHSEGSADAELQCQVMLSWTILVTLVGAAIALAVILLAPRSASGNSASSKLTTGMLVIGLLLKGFHSIVPAYLSISGTTPSGTPPGYCLVQVQNGQSSCASQISLYIMISAATLLLVAVAWLGLAGFGVFRWLKAPSTP